MAKAGVEVLGFDELQRKLRQVKDAVKGAELRKATQAGAAVVRRDAQRRAPKRSGRLAKAIRTRSKILGPTQAQVEIGVNRKMAWYGHLVEFGHKLVRKKRVIGHVPARPFLRPAIEERRNEVVAKMREVFSRNLAKVTRGNSGRIPRR